MAMKFALPLLFTLALTAIADAVPTPVAVTKVGDAVLDERGMTLCEDAWFGRAINGQAFQQDGITSFRGYQYATYFVTDHPSAEAAQRFYLAVARRKIDGGRWEVANLIDADFHNGTGIKPSPWDAHNTASIGICPGDGSIHLAYDHHDSVLRYRATGPAVATDPQHVKWSAGLFKPETAELVAGEAITTRMLVAMAVIIVAVVVTTTARNVSTP